MSFIAILIASLFGSPHCAGMCGAFATISGASPNLGQSLRGVTLYHFGRLNTYLLLGMLAAYIGQAVNLGGEFVGVANLAAVIAGLILIYWGLQGLIMGKRGVLATGKHFTWLAKFSSKVMTVSGQLGGEIAKPYLLGLFSTFLPCGWLYSFLIVAAAAGSTQGALGGVWVMFAFWLGTLPILTLLGLASNYLVSLKSPWTGRLTYTLLVVAGLFSISGRVGLDLSDPQALEDHCAPAAQAEEIKPLDYRAELVFSGSGILWGMDFIDEDNLIVTKRSGELFLVDLKSKAQTPVSGVPKVHAKGQGGLLDVAVSPDFEKNNFVYLSYSASEGSGFTTKAARATLSGARLDNLTEIFTAKPSFRTTHHFGSRISFDSRGYLYLTVGDRGKRDLAQSLESHNGKVIRINRNGGVPKTNPFVNTPQALPEIYSFGHRNQQGMYFDKVTDKLFVQEHGPRGGDEINISEPGKNYGWPIITYGKEYYGPSIGEGTKKEGMEQPLYYFVPSIAPSGLVVHQGEKYPELKGAFISGAMVLRHLNILIPKEDGSYQEIRLFKKLEERIRNVEQSPEGFIYFSL